MSNIAIRVESLSKQYNIGGLQVPYRTIRESIIDTLTSPIQWLTDPKSKVRKSGSETIWALKDISFEIKQGEVVGIIGRNGAGKSTLLKILSRVTRPTFGRAEVYGRLGSLLEVGTGFHPELTGRENIYLNGAILGMKRAEIEGRFDEIVAFAEIEKFLDTPVKRYSSGMYVRLAFAVAAHLEPEILLVDEVLAVGDSAFQKKCLGKMQDVAEGGRTVLFVSHNLPTVQRLCSYGYLLNQGGIVAQGNIESVLDTYYEIMEDADNQHSVDVERVPEGKVQYVSWRLHSSETHRAHHCFTQEPCIFDFQLIVRRAVKAAGFAMFIFDNNGNWIWGGRRGAKAEECIPLTEGIYQIRFQLPMLPVKPGRYVLLVTASDFYEEGNLDEWYAQPRLVVLPKDESIAADPWCGILNLKSEIEVSKLRDILS